MSSIPLVSIQIPTYNQKQYIKEALDSALAQTYENLQIIVSDDCSPDYDIFEYLKEYKNNPKVLLHRNEKNLGRVGNYRNTLYNLVSGDWFVNLDGDDYFINDEFISTAIASINIAATNVIAFQSNCNMQIFTESSIVHQILDEEMMLVDGKSYLPFIDKSVGFSHGSLLYKVAAAKKVDFYNFDTLDIDYFSYLKILKEGYIIFWKAKVYSWRKHNSQETDSLNFQKSLDKYAEYNDLLYAYKDIDSTIKNVMLERTYYDLTVRLLTHFFHEEFSIKRLVIIICKTKLHSKYWKPILSLAKHKMQK